MVVTMLCTKCKHFHVGTTGRFALSCAAFPDRIPQEIVEVRHNHRHPYPGDHGIQFEPKDEGAHVSDQS